MNRIEKGEYPIPAMREMLLNALVHRNYMGAAIQIRVFDDRISVWNDGTLPSGVTADSLKRSHSSKPRNTIIADVTFKGGFIDSWGRGTIRILETCKEAELPEPEMIEQDGGFAITLFKDVLNEDQLRKLGLNERQVKAVLYVKEKGRITNSEYQEINAISKRTATTELTELTESFSMLNKIGSSGSAIYYKLIGQ